VSRLKQILGLAGIMLALAGFGLDSRPLVWAAVGVLGLSVLLRLILSYKARRAESHPDQE
jgi:hypothetical protein